VIANNNDSQTDILRKLQELQAENQALRNEVEKLQFETVQAADRQRQLYMDLDQRLQAMTSGSPAGAGAVAGAAPDTGSRSPFVTEGALVTTSANTSAEADYQVAFDLLKQGNYSQASSAFTRFLAVHPDSNLRDNAEYWLAETSYAQQKFTEALEGFQNLISTYPTSRKIPDAWLKVGYCQAELQRLPEARQALNIVITQYPETTSARLARDKLTAISGGR
jgi:tol-pal system protein YbgF